jgi:hypothetical protein
MKEAMLSKNPSIVEDQARLAKRPEDGAEFKYDNTFFKKCFRLIAFAPMEDAACYLWG